VSICPDPPDVSCEVEGEGKVAFELVEVIDREYRRRLSVQLSLPQLVESCREQLPAPQVSELQARLGNALIHIEFQTAASAQQRYAAIPRLLRVLATADSSLEGPVPLVGQRGLAKAIREVRIARGSFSGPCFESGNADWLDTEVLLKRLQEKFNASYRPKVPTELLAYFDWQPVLPDEVWVPGCRRFVEAGLATSPFRRVRIFDRNEQTMRFVWPEALP
jgi:hypothetical protein